MNAGVSGPNTKILQLRFLLNKNTARAPGHVCITYRNWLVSKSCRHANRELQHLSWLTPNRITFITNSRGWGTHQSITSTIGRHKVGRNQRWDLQCPPTRMHGFKMLPPKWCPQSRIVNILKIQEIVYPTINSHPPLSTISMGRCCLQFYQHSWSAMMRVQTGKFSRGCFRKKILSQEQHQKHWFYCSEPNY
jgi:hypothetical protein